MEKNNLHKNHLGYDIPKDYFSNSKMKILDTLGKNQKKEQPIHNNRKWTYLIAASLAFLVGFSFWFKSNINKTVIEITEDNDQLISTSNDFTIDALFYDDVGVDNFIEEVIVDEIVFMAEQSETQLDNIFINSLLIEERSLDSYLDTNFLNSIIY